MKTVYKQPHTFYFTVSSFSLFFVLTCLMTASEKAETWSIRARRN